MPPVRVGAVLVLMLVGGLVLLAFGAQGAIRVGLDHDRAEWVPGPWWARLIIFVLIAVVGMLLADRGKTATPKS